MQDLKKYVLPCAPGDVGSFSSYYSSRLIANSVFQYFQCFCMFLPNTSVSPQYKVSRRAGYKDSTIVSSPAFVTLSAFIDAVIDEMQLFFREGATV